MRKILFLMLALMALASCEKHPRYYVLYLSATVVDESGNPIQGIEASPEGESFKGRTGYSNYKGEINGFVHIAPRTPLFIVIEDVDGEANGGEFESQRIDITDRVHYCAPDEWGFSGSDNVKLGTITLKSKEQR